MSEAGEPIARFQWSGVLDYGEIRLFEATISVRQVRRLHYEYTESFSLDTLLPEYSTVRYRRSTFAGALLFIAILGLFLGIAAICGKLQVVSPITMVTVLLLVGWALIYWPLGALDLSHDHAPAVACRAWLGWLRPSGGRERTRLTSSSSRPPASSTPSRNSWQPSGQTSSPIR